jgi:hypothetical protein
VILRRAEGTEGANMGRHSKPDDSEDEQDTGEIWDVTDVRHVHIGTTQTPAQGPVANFRTFPHDRPSEGG